LVTGARVMTSSKTASPRTFALLLVSMAAICAFGVIAMLSTVNRGEVARVAPVELDGGQGARGGHQGSEPDRRRAGTGARGCGRGACAAERRPVIGGRSAAAGGAGAGTR
jgi:hypothetical protein